MKRRTLPKPNANDSLQSRLGSSTRGGTPAKTIPVKKATKKRPARSAALSILGLKKPEPTSEGSTRWSSDESSAVDHAAECQRLREQLERVLVDHQRQEEEIVALRALAKSLKVEVETIHERQQLRWSTCNSDKTVQRGRRTIGSHEFFKLDVQVEELYGENAELRRQLENYQEDLKAARTCIAQKLPVYKLAAVKANAELRCVKSQLQQERDHSDLLQKQLVRRKARQDDVPVRVSLERGNNQKEHDDDPQESAVVRREREVFLRQCMRLQDDKAPLSLDHKQKTHKASEADGVDVVVKLKKEQIKSDTDFVSSTCTSLELDAAMKTDTLIHEDLLGLDFYLNELDLSIAAAPTRSKQLN
ncbi:hypothetical protein PHYPSEUDO_002653 [Phytophthora pseudosyringae]|uniref:Uncharacterized protein n=1 Tax=Phytophthora pseudosyringae TaxID=221518 RepID=A0A8T1VSI9_9STRA|nr:hypothetical protein PHYPSEUDO_002653 [Phytophthora pseudosyringae]